MVGLEGRIDAAGETANWDFLAIYSQLDVNEAGRQEYTTKR